MPRAAIGAQPWYTGRYEYSCVIISKYHIPVWWHHGWRLSGACHLLADIPSVCHWVILVEPGEVPVTAGPDTAPVEVRCDHVAETAGCRPPYERSGTSHTCSLEDPCSTYDTPAVKEHTMVYQNMLYHNMVYHNNWHWAISHMCSLEDPCSTSDTPAVKKTHNGLLTRIWFTRIWLTTIISIERRVTDIL